MNPLIAGVARRPSDLSHECVRAFAFAFGNRHGPVAFAADHGRWPHQICRCPMALPVDGNTPATNRQGRPYSRFLAYALHNPCVNRDELGWSRKRIALLPSDTGYYKSFNELSGIINRIPGHGIIDARSDSFASICSLPVRFPDAALRKLVGLARARRPQGTQAFAWMPRSRWRRLCDMPGWE